ncbi:ester cyclase [Candidatus Bipolaricaulota bacterium]|jgi:predicted ester cyclase|nr:ester cyclase [Candidatus Bipolaricaulota bacterium]
MTKVLGVLLLAVLAVGILGVAQTAVTPRAAEGVLLFDNETGAEVTRIGILFDSPVTLCKDDVVTFGGEAVTRLDMGIRTAWIDAVVVSGGTLQVNLTGSANVSSAYWVSSVQEKSKVVCGWLIEAMWNTGDLDLIAEFMAPSSVFHGDGFVGELPGVEGYKGFATVTYTALPDIHFTIEDLVAEDDMVAARLSYTGTNTGPFMTLPATGVSITSRAMVIYRFADGMIQEGWIQVDGLAMLIQMGVLPPMGAPNFGWGTPSTATGDPGTPEENKVLTSREPLEVWNEANLGVIEKIIAEGFVGHYDMGNTVDGIEGFRQYVSGLLNAFPDFHVTVNELFAENDLVVFQATASGTNLGAFGPIPATGKSWKNTAIVIRRVADGKIIELWQLGDMLSLLTQIGLVPPLQ